MSSAIALTNARGERVELSAEGAGISAIFVRDRLGRIADVTVAAGGSAGKTIGRYANRIANGRFWLDGRRYTLLTNEGSNTLHGGPEGFSKRTWDVASRRADGGRTTGIAFTLCSPDGDQGFPGELHCNVRYAFDDAGALRLDYAATTKKPTVINLTNHVYVNLSAEAGSTIVHEELRIAARAYLPVDRAMIPSGAIAPVEGTKLDFSTVRPIGAEIYDCTFVLERSEDVLRPAAELRDKTSGRRLVVETTEPGLQLYTGKSGAVALETQRFPDAPNHPNFPSAVLRPGEMFTSTTILRFSIDGITSSD
jgi:aldose 1-epimerase